MKHLSIALLVPLIAACVDSAPELGVETSEIGSCPKWGCGENSPLMTTIGYFHELHPDGLPNAQQMSVLDFRFEISGKAYRPRLVNGSRLVVDYDDAGQTVTLSGHQLEGGWFNLHAPTGSYRLFIDHVTTLAESQVRFWVGAAEPIETYTLTYQTPGQSLPDKHQVLCNHAPAQSRTGASGDGPWVNPLEAFFFSGDRYDADHKTVAAIDDTSGFFNIACAGSALAKLHLNRHTSLGSPGPNGQVPSQAKRQAMLKMYVSDLCGTGSAWTIKGTPLFFSDSAGWFHMPSIPLQHEAYWREYGATCLDVHRLGSLYADEIKTECPRLLPCPTFPSKSAYFSSAFPAP